MLNFVLNFLVTIGRSKRDLIKDVFMTKAYFFSWVVQYIFNPQCTNSAVCAKGNHPAFEDLSWKSVVLKSMAVAADSLALVDFNILGFRRIWFLRLM